MRKVKLRGKGCLHFLLLYPGIFLTDSWIAEIFNSAISHVRLANMQSQAFLVSLSIPLPNSFRLVATKAASDCSELPSTATEEDEEDIQDTQLLLIRLAWMLL